MHHDDSTADLLMGAARSMRTAFVAALKQADVTPGQARALRMVLETEPTRLSGLAERLMIVPRSATEVVDALEDRGLVERQPDPTDRRATAVVLTPEGRRLVAVIGAARRDAQADFLASLSEDDRSELDRILRLLVDRDAEDRS